MRIRLVFIALAIAACASSPAPAGAAAAGGGNNVVIVNNTGDAQTASRASARVSYDAADTVANTNTAIADSSACTGCETVAVAMQVVIVETSPSTFVPANVAAATNGGCTSCVTEAYAFQHIVQPATPVTLSANAQQQLAELRSDASTIAASDVSFAERQAELQAVFDQMVNIVDTEMSSVGVPATASYVSSRAA